MPRIKPIDAANATGAVADQLSATRKMLGWTPNMFMTAANSAAALTSMNTLFASLSKGKLGGKTGELVTLAIAEANGCEYCLSAHTAIGHLQGLSSSELAAAKHGDSSDSKARAAMGFALAVLEAKGRVSDATVAEAHAAGLDDTEIVELVAYVALNVFTNYLNNLAGTEVDFPLVRLEQAA
jgi:uncharacterized peroxidase-related enzyme